MSVASIPAGYWENPFPSLNIPKYETPIARSLVSYDQNYDTNRQFPNTVPARQLFTDEQIQNIISRLPASFVASQVNRFQLKSTTSTTTTTTTTTPAPTTTTTTTTTSTTRRPPIIRRRRLRTTTTPKFVSQFHYGGLESREEYGAVGPTEDDAVVLLVGLFNLLAVVVYAANKYVTGERGGLSDRVIQWQVQKVLDELVIKVHSSQYMANLLSRSMPSHLGMPPVDKKGAVDFPPDWMGLVLEKIKVSAMQNHSREIIELLQEAKERLMTEIGSSPAAMSTVRLHPRIYRPLKKLYATITTEGGLTRAVENIMGGFEGETGRGLTSTFTNLNTLLNTLSLLNMSKVQSILASLTALGRAQQRMNVLPALVSAMKNTMSSQISTRQSRVISEADPEFAGNFLRQLRRSRTSKSSQQPHPRVSSSSSSRYEEQRETPYNRRYSRLMQDSNRNAENDRRSNSRVRNNSRYRSPNSNSNTRGSQLMKRMGVVENENSVAPNGHWTDKWFSLVTQVSPVGLDMTTLYARARAKPTCLRALLCRANNAWRQVGPVQAALTPFTSVLVSWILEDTPPHSLGDSLIAIRAGWMGKDCTFLYPECPLHPDPHPAAKEAITFFSRLQFAATQAPERSPSTGTRPLQNTESNSGHMVDRIDSSDVLDSTGPSNALNPITSPNKDDTTTPQPTYYSQDRPYTNSPPRQPQNYHFTEYKRTQRPQTDFNQEGNANGGTPAAATIHAYYDRYGGEGPMSVPGSQYNSKYGQADEDVQSNKQNNDRVQLYEKYDSPASTSAEGEISGSNSVAGMALQDRPTGNNPKVWEEFFRAGVYGGNFQNTSPSKQKESKDETAPAKSPRPQLPLRRQPVSSLNKMGALLPDQLPSNNQAYPTYTNKFNNNNNNKQNPLRQNRPLRPYFNLRHPIHKRPQTTAVPSNTPLLPAPPQLKKYKYGLRRGLPAANVNGYTAYTSSSGNLYQRQKPWYLYTTRAGYRPTPPTPPRTTTTTTTSTTTTPSTTTHPLASKDVAPFGPEDAVTDVLRNELLFEYIRDRQGSIPIDDK